MIYRFFRERIERFLRDKRGNFATMLSLAAMPVMLAIGMAVDYTAISRYKSKLQNHLDAALLSTGEDISRLSEDSLKTQIEEFLLANAGPKLFAQIDSLQVTLGNNRQSLTANAKGSIDTSFMMLAGVNELDYDVTAQIRGGSSSVEVALVLDNTLSMSADNKLDDLKIAATRFTDALMSKATGGDTKIGIVPFAEHVNIGMWNRGAPWLDVQNDHQTVRKTCGMTRDIISTSNCRDETYYIEGIPHTRKVCDYTYGPEYYTCRTGIVHHIWTGCVGSRQRPRNLEDRDYNSEKVPGLMSITCSAPITPLTNVRQDVLDNISSMVANGKTYIPAGLTWGLRLLSSHAPYSEGATDAQVRASNIKKVLVLMTDGENE